MPLTLALCFASVDIKQFEDIDIEDFFSFFPERIKDNACTLSLPKAAPKFTQISSKCFLKSYI